MASMATVISIANQKGGVAKTTTTRHLAYFLDKLGKRVLLIDNDHQANLTQYMGVDPVECEKNRGTMFDVLINQKPINDVRVSPSGRVWLVPSCLALAEASARLQMQADVNNVLKRALEPVLSDYDVVLIDCGPNLERLLINALVASDYLLVPTKTDSLSISGLSALVSTVDQVKPMNPHLQYLGVLPTIYHAGRQADEKTMALLREDEELAKANIRVFNPIPSATNYDKAADERRPVFELFPDTKGRAEYEELAVLISNL